MGTEIRKLLGSRCRSVPEEMGEDGWVLLRLSEEGKATHDKNTRAELLCSLAAFTSENWQQGLAAPWVKAGVSPTSSSLPRDPQHRGTPASSTCPLHTHTSPVHAQRARSSSEVAPGICHLHAIRKGSGQGLAPAPGCSVVARAAGVPSLQHSQGGGGSELAATALPDGG